MWMIFTHPVTLDQRISASHRVGLHAFHYSLRVASMSVSCISSVTLILLDFAAFVVWTDVILMILCSCSASVPQRFRPSVLLFCLLLERIFISSLIASSTCTAEFSSFVSTTSQPLSLILPTFRLSQHPSLRLSTLVRVLSHGVFGDMSLRISSSSSHSFSSRPPSLYVVDVQRCQCVLLSLSLFGVFGSIRYLPPWRSHGCCRCRPSWAVSVPSSVEQFFDSVDVCRTGFTQRRHPPQIWNLHTSGKFTQHTAPPQCVIDSVTWCTSASPVGSVRLSCTGKICLHVLLKQFAWRLCHFSIPSNPATLSTPVRVPWTGVSCQMDVQFLDGFPALLLFHPHEHSIFKDILEVPVFRFESVHPRRHEWGIVSFPGTTFLIACLKRKRTPGDGRHWELSKL